MEIRRRYNELERRRGGQPLDALKLAKGFKKDVADLIEVMEAHGGDRKKLNQELANCLWSLLIIAQKLDVDIERAFWTTMLEIDHKLDQEMR